LTAATEYDCQAARVKYGHGAKVPSDTAVPGRDFTKFDCSGFVRAAIRRATDPVVPLHDGSVVQQEWVQDEGFVAGSVADGMLTDGKVRIAFLNPKDSPEGIGHVVLVCNAVTAESHGGVGPDARPFDGQGWQCESQGIFAHHLVCRYHPLIACRAFDRGRTVESQSPRLSTTERNQNLLSSTEQRWCRF
jgi:hypothetical protein